MKYDFSNLNIAPMPNPKPLCVERIFVVLETQDGKTSGQMQGIVRNSSLHPYAVVNGRW